ncbi:MAG: hypothetical protein ACRDJB_01950 [Actinomycetota bacterium]
MDWQAADWSALGQVGALVVAVVAGILVWRQVRHTAQAREDQTRPYVIVDFEFQGWEVLLAIRNIGTSPAMDVQITFDKPLQAPHIEDPDELAVFTDGIPMLAPGRLIAIPFGNGPNFFSEGVDEKLPLRYVARVEYSGHGGRKRYRDADLVLDLTPYKHTLIERDDLHQIYQNLKEIKTVMKSWTSDRRLRVNTVKQTEVVEQHRQRWGEQTARRAAQPASADPSESPASE